MLIALARPVMDLKEQDFKQEITPIVVIIDISKSMLASDISPTRLKMAKYKLLELINISKDSALAVVLFAKSAFILSPITQDFNSLKYLVNNFDDTKNFDNGSNILASLEAANKLLKNYNNKNVLILSDGGNKEDFKEEINYAKQNDIKVYNLALATSKPTPIKINDSYLMDENDNIVTVSLNENIKELSFETKGAYMTYTISNSDIKAIYNDIMSSSSKDELKSQKYKVYKELFYYPLALGILFLLFAFSSMPSKKSLILVSLLLLANKESLNASILDFKTINEANQQYTNKEYKKASESFYEVSQTKEGHYNYANALYKDKKYKTALSEYKKVISSNKDLEYKKLHNMGNTYVKLKDLENAKKLYENALKLEDNLQTKENLAYVNKLLKKKQENKNNKKKDKKENKDKDKKQDKEKNQKQKDKKNNKEQENKKDSKKDKKEQEEKEAKNSSNKNSKDEKKEKSDKESKASKSSKSEALNKDEMSELEEKKWLKKIQNKKTPILLRKFNSKSEDNTSTPW